VSGATQTTQPYSDAAEQPRGRGGSAGPYQAWTYAKIRPLCPQRAGLVGATGFVVQTGRPRPYTEWTFRPPGLSLLPWTILEESTGQLDDWAGW